MKKEFNFKMKNKTQLILCKNMKSFILKILFIYLFLLDNINCQEELVEWKSPYFECLPRDDNKINCTDKTTLDEVDVEEEIPWSFDLVQLNYKGDIKPVINKFTIGLESSLVPTFEKRDNGYWIMKINNRQDYELENQKMYRFEITIDKTKREMIINLKNIFDNKPEVRYLGPIPCKWKAKQSNVVTDCKVLIKDPDGLKDNQIKMSVKGDNDEDKHFSFVLIKDSRTQYTQNYSINIEEELDFDKNALYNLNITASDIANNTGYGEATVSVINVPHSNPRWIKPIVIETFKEKQRQIFKVAAISADVGVTIPICYNLLFPDGDYSHLIQIEEKSAEINGEVNLEVAEINRDALQQEIFKFEVTAENCDNSSMKTIGEAVLYVQDINDNAPKITLKPEKIKLYENKTQTINLDEFKVSDIDLGEHAMYEVYLNEANESFSIVPNSGYQNSSFQLTIINKDYLDYENEEWRNIKLKIVAQETNDTNHKDEFILYIELINWNDEPPIFTKSEYSVELKETVPKNSKIGNLTATDRDIDDNVTYKILGHIYGIAIDENNGTVYTSDDDVFDYDRQKSVIIQIEAKDNLKTDYSNKTNSAFTQLTINVIDVNNKTPELRMPRQVTNCTENTTDIGTITDGIKATDPDTDADLFFEIDWNESYATKTGVIVNDISKYKECFIIEPVPHTRNEVYGHLILNPENKTIVDYEEYDTIYLFIIVTDKNQVINEPSSNATLTVIITDINDCAPEFILNTLEDSRMVMEEAMENNPVGNLILARDRDGPGNNNITYSLTPINNTNSSWVTIDPSTGVLTVQKNAKIDCDEPRIDALYYEIQLNDGVFETTGNIMISVTDINNKVPYFENFNRTAEIYENATFVTQILQKKYNSAIIQILGKDKDRDDPHNVLEYSINYKIYKELQKFFKVDQKNGTVFIDLDSGYDLDRDHGVTQHIIYVDVKDNFLDPRGGRRNQEYVNITVNLLDVNDNAPIMKNPKDFQPKISETAQKDDVLEGYIITAEDIDQPEHPNSWVSFEILNITPGEECNPNANDYQNIFRMIGDYEKRNGQFVANNDLKGFYGNWKINIKAYDHGEPHNNTVNETYTLVVEPYNFHKPQIIFPQNGITIRLRHDQIIDEPLKYINDTQLKSFEAYDPDGGIYGNVTFEIFPESEYFKINYINKSTSFLALKSEIGIGSYSLNIKAKDGGNENAETQITVFIVDMKGDPYFEKDTFYTKFTEGEKGVLDEYATIPEAKDPKNEGIEIENEKIKVFYYLDENFNSDVTEKFTLNDETRILKPIKPLSRSDGIELSLKVIATNSKKKEVTSYSQKSELTITVKVKDANPKPVFDDLNKKYGGSITVGDYENKTILQVHANDSDIENSKTTYYISGTIDAHGDNINPIKDTIFDLDPDSGVLKLNYKIDSSMSGYFEFNITAKDTAGNKDEAKVNVYIIAESNRIAFTFAENVSLIQENKNFIKDTLKKEYDYDLCNIDDISTASNATKVLVHFIRNDAPISADEILGKSNKQLILNLRSSFMKRQILLVDIIDAANAEKLEKLEATSSTALIVIAVILGILCGLLVVAFVLKTRALNRQLKAFAPPEFGSRASDLNRIGVPTTNVFSVEGSNPVINDNTIKEEYDDTSSIDSDGSDFVGINNDVNFMRKNESVSSKNSSQYENHNENNRNSFDKNNEKIMRF